MFVVAPKSDARLRQKMQVQGSFLFSWAQRVELFQLLLEEEGMAACFDDGFRNFTGSAMTIRVQTDRAFAAMGARVFRVMGEDRVRDHGVEDDPLVLSTPRGSLSSTEIRQRLVHDADSLVELVGHQMAQHYRRCFETTQAA